MIANASRLLAGPCRLELQEKMLPMLLMIDN